MREYYETGEAAQDQALEEVFQLLNQKHARKQCNPESSITDGLDQEKRYIRATERASTRSRAEREARLRTIEISEQCSGTEKDDLNKWSPSRARDRSDFQYLFLHRKRFGQVIQEHLEIVSAKINHISNDGRDGYFKKLEKNVGWTDYILPIIFSRSKYADKIVRCGIWANAKNSRRCHKTDFCPLCHWNDKLKVLVQAFGTKTGAFARALCWTFITCGFTTSKNNSKAVGRPLTQDDFAHVRGDEHYDAYPVRLGNDDDDPDYFADGYTDARILAVIVQEALDELYQSKIIDGYRNKIEGAFRLKTDGGVYVNMHGHAIANGPETNLQHIANLLQSSIRRGLRKYQRELMGTYFPDVLALGISTAENLLRCIVYSEKVIALNCIVKDAMRQPGALLEDGTPCPRYIAALDLCLKEFLDDHVPNLFSGFKLDGETCWLRRRKTVGNMQFKEKRTCIGKEPMWHKKVRRKRAKALKKKRREREKREKKAGLKTTALALPQKRSRKNPRRLARTLKKMPSRKTAKSGELRRHPKMSPVKPPLAEQNLAEEQPASVDGQT